MERKSKGDSTTDQDSSVLVLPFDYSIENHFRAIDTISELCGVKEEEEASRASEMEHFSSKVTFLRQWKDFRYESRTIRFTHEIGSPQEKDVCEAVNLPQFSAASVPKLETLSSETSHTKARKDFVLYVGGHVWALDWCPSVHQRSDCHTKCEYLAVAAHPPESSYHKVGAALTGRGVIQIWCLLNVSVKEEELPPLTKPKGKGRGRPRKKMATEESCSYLDSNNLFGQADNVQSDNEADKTSPPLKKAKGRPRKKKVTEECVDDIDSNNQFGQADDVQLDKETDKTLPPLKKPRGRPRKKTVTEESFGDLDSNNQLVQVPAVQLDKEMDETSPPVKKARGRPRKKAVTEESFGEFDSNDHFVQPLAIQLAKETDTTSPPLKKTKGRPRKTMVTEESLGDLDSNNHFVQPLAIQLKETDKTSPPLKKTKGRTRKKIVTEESFGDLDSNNHLVQPLAIQLEKEADKTSPPLKKTKGRPRKRLVNEESCGHVDNNNQSAQALVVQSDKDTGVTSQTLPKAKGRRRKQKAITGSSNDCNKDRQVVPALIELPEDPSAVLAETGTLIHANNQSAQALVVQSDTDTGVTSQTLPKAKGRRRKQKAITGSSNDCNKDRQVGPALIELPEDPSAVLAETGTLIHANEHAAVVIPDNDVELQTETQEGCDHAVSACKPCLTNTPRKKRKRKDKAREEIHSDSLETYDPLLLRSMPKESSSAVLKASIDCESSQKEVTDGCFDTNKPDIHLPNDVALPRVVLCLAHNGKVAWDVKWRPSNIHDSKQKHFMGYLAVLLGNGSLEVWEVPFPRTIKVLYSSYKEEATDPRFVKLAPVFRCSELKVGDRQSIPLTLEWSRSSPHDLILAGCHDGTVALWKFSSSGSCEDTRPLLCFSADNAPIRALAWAPCEGDAESANVIATAGHGGLKFWDLRDPYRPLWDLSPIRRVIYGLDWLPDPRCLIMSSDDGTLRILSLSKAAYDVPVTGTPFVGTQHQGLHSYFCSSFPIWSVHASRPAGMVAYCSSDGTVLRFQLTAKAVEKDPSRNRTPHFLCGSLRDEDSILAVNTPLTDNPFPMKKSLNEWGDTPTSIRGFLSHMNQAKRANYQTSNDKILALCNGDDTSNIDSEMTPVTQKSKTTPKPKAAKKKTPVADQSLAIIEELETPQEGGENQKKEKETKIEVFPSKIVAMHRVRWNMNQGSERWLCYGGAAGIVRCQEISMPSIP